jgi:hypothetical protein
MKSLVLSVVIFPFLEGRKALTAGTNANLLL